MENILIENEKNNDIKKILLIAYIIKYKLYDLLIEYYDILINIILSLLQNN